MHPVVPIKLFLNLAIRATDTNILGAADFLSMGIVQQFPMPRRFSEKSDIFI